MKSIKLIIAGIVAGLSMQAMAAGIPVECKQAVQTHCKAVKPGDGRELTCLQFHLFRISEKACVGKLFDETAGPALPAACEADVKKHCANVRPGAGRRVACLVQNEPVASPACKKVLEGEGLTMQNLNKPQ